MESMNACFVGGVTKEVPAGLKEVELTSEEGREAKLLNTEGKATHTLFRLKRFIEKRRVGFPGYVWTDGLEAGRQADRQVS